MHRLVDGDGGGPGVTTVQRPARYALVSLFCGGLAQLGLAFAYGVLGWSAAAAVWLSLAVSVGPSYWGSRIYVWKGLSRRNRRTEFLTFIGIALAGTVVAMALTALSQTLGQLLTDNRGALTAWVCVGSVASTAVVWAARYLVLDRYLFRSRR